MEQYKPMRSPSLKRLFCLLLLTLMLQPLLAERVSVKLSFMTNSLSGEEINSWISATNTKWRDLQALRGGDLQGQFQPIDFGSSLEAELRVPLYKGLAFNVAGSFFSAEAEGQIEYNRGNGTEVAQQFIRNTVSAIPVKIGLSYAFPLPALPRLKLLAGLGREIIFVKYKSTNNFEDLFSQGVDLRYWFEKDSTFNSEKLGWYFNFGAEFDLLDFLAVVAEAENVWGAAVDGFKGPESYRGFLGSSSNQEQFDINGKPSLYYYEERGGLLNDYYPTLSSYYNFPEDAGASGYQRPEGENFKNVRQGVLEFNTFSLKLGIRLKF
jgi:hypothetical protein